MLSAISQLQILNPLGLLLAVAAPFLIFAYMRTQSKKPITVSSIFILESLSKRPVAKSSIKLPFRFFLELLALLLLCLAAASPFLLSESGRVAVVIDNSMSMASRESQNSDKTRLDSAKEMLSDRLSKLPSGSSVSLYTSSPELTLVSTKDIGPSAAKRLLGEVSIFDASDSLGSSVTSLVASNSFAKVLVATDKSNYSSSDEPELSADELKKFTEIEIIEVGQVVSNYFINSVSFAKQGLNETDRTIEVEATFSGVGEPKVYVTLFSVALGDPLNRATYNRIAQKEAVLSENRKQITFELSDSSSSPLFLIELRDIQDTATPPRISSSNANARDDAAWLSLEARSKDTVLLVSPAAGESSLGLDNIAGLQVDRVSPEQFAQMQDDQKKEYSIWIFHQTSPTSFPQVASLLVLPPNQNPIAPVLREVQNTKITSWSEEDPLTSYLRIQLLAPQSSLVFESPDWAKSVINSEFGPLVVAGETEGVRVVAVGMELLPFEGASTPAASVLSLNILNWLRKGSDLGSDILTGSTNSLSTEEEWIVLTPQGTIEKTAGDTTNKFVFETPGPYLFSNRTTSARELMIVNSFFPEESQTAAKSSTSLKSKLAKNPKEEDSTNALWRYLILFGLFLLLAEFAMRYRKRVGRS